MRGLLTIALILCAAALAIVFVAVTNRAQSQDVDARLRTFIETTCVADRLGECRVNVAQLTDFAWDMMYFIDSGATLDANPDLVPVPLPRGYNFDDGKFIFTYRGELVHFEEVPIEVEYVPKDSILIDTRDGYSFARAEALFRVRKADGPDGAFYVLYR